MTNNRQGAGYALMRVAMGVNLLAHGLVRIPKIGAFRDWMVEFFQSTPLPSWVVAPYATVLPFVELLIGALLILGLFTHRAAVAGGMLMVLLIFGSCLAEQWEWVGFQTLYVFAFYTLIVQGQHNSIALDTRVRQPAQLA